MPLQPRCNRHSITLFARFELYHYYSPILSPILVSLQFLSRSNVQFSTSLMLLSPHTSRYIFCMDQNTHANALSPRRWLVGPMCHMLLLQSALLPGSLFPFPL